jgi:hypothetical protein
LNLGFLEHMLRSTQRRVELNIGGDERSEHKESCLILKTAKGG